MATASNQEEKKPEQTHLQIVDIIQDVQDDVNIATTGLPGDPFTPRRNAPANSMPLTAAAREVMTQTFEMELQRLNDTRRRQGQPPLINLTALNFNNKDEFVHQLITAVSGAAKAQKFSEGTPEAVAIPATGTADFRVGMLVRLDAEADMDFLGIPWRVMDQVGEVEAVHRDEIEVYFEDEGETYYIRPRHLRAA